MNNDFLSDAMNEISDKHIAEAATYKLKAKALPLKKLIAAAACIGVVAASALAVMNTGSRTQPTASYPDSTYPSITAPTTVAAIDKYTTEISQEPTSTTVAYTPPVVSGTVAGTTIACDGNRTTDITNEPTVKNEIFPEIVKATLYVDGIAEEISPDDSRLIKMTDYIMKSYNEHSYTRIQGVLDQNTVEEYYMSKAKAYMELEMEGEASAELGRYDRAIIAYDSVIMIDSDSVSYHGEGNPFNFCFSPYNTGCVPVAPILYVCGFINSSAPYRES